MRLAHCVANVASDNAPQLYHWQPLPWGLPKITPLSATCQSSKEQRDSPNLQPPSRSSPKKSDTKPLLQAQVELDVSLEFGAWDLEPPRLLLFEFQRRRIDAVP